MSKVYLVTSGEYSDYQVLAVFSTEDKAKIYIQSLQACGDKYLNDIEEYCLDPAYDIDAVNPNNYPAWCVVIYKDYNIRSATTNDYNIRNALEGNKEYYIIPNQLDLLVLYLFAKDQQHAVKIASDKLSQILATVGWGNLIE